MKRIGYIIEEIVECDNLNNSFDQVVCGTARKESKEGKWLIANREKFLLSVRRQILSQHIILHGWHERIIFEANKERHIQVFCMKDRILINAVMTVVDKYLKRRFIRTTSSSIKGRGMHDLKAYIERDIQDDPDNMRYFYKMDIRRFYDNIPQKLVHDCLCRIFKDQRLVEILDGFIYLMPQGLSMGMRSSQGFGNLILSVILDHKMKDKYGSKHYYRYCDDVLIGCATKEECWKARKICHNIIESSEMKIKPNESIFPIECGIDMLGYVIYKNHSRIRKRVKKNFARKIKRVKSRKRREKLIGSFYGLAKHSDTRNLLRLLLNKNEMKKFSELNICCKDKNGKKTFDAENVSLSNLEGKEIIVLDYENDISTKFGRSKTVVLFKYNDDSKDEFKFFTAGQFIKNALEQASEENEIPFIATIVKTNKKGSSSFKFA